jgi:hypothetical protein
MVRANAYLTYEFTADPGQPTVLNGSTITLDPANDTVLGWNLIDSTALPAIAPFIGFSLDSAFPVGGSSDFLTAPGTLLSPGLSSANADGFTGTFAVYDFAYPIGMLDFVSPTSLSDELVVWSLADPALDPVIIGHNIPGTWSDPSPVSAPDVVSTFGMLLLGAGAMGAWRRRYNFNQR